MNRFLITLGVLLLLFAFGPAPMTFAQVDEPEEQAEDVTNIEYRGWGIQGGGTFQPDQFHIGGHLNMGSFAERGFVRPVAELGFGDDLTLFSGTLDLGYRFQTDWDQWGPYLGAAPGIFISSFDEENQLSDDTDVDFGVYLLGGVEKNLANGNKFFVQGNVGFADAPDFKVSLGWTFMQ